MVHASLETKWRVQTINCFFRQAQTVAFYLSLVVFHVPFFICCSQKNLLCSSQWLCQTILCRLVEQIEAVNETLCRIGCSELQVGSE